MSETGAQGYSINIKLKTEDSRDVQQRRWKSVNPKPVKSKTLTVILYCVKYGSFR